MLCSLASRNVGISPFSLLSLVSYTTTCRRTDVDTYVFYYVWTIFLKNNKLLQVSEAGYLLKTYNL